jgi:cell fate regulator YaaT (PSP1 superfamily)
MSDSENYDDEIEEDISSLEDNPIPVDFENPDGDAGTEPIAPDTLLYRLRLDYANEHFIAGCRGDPLNPGDKVMVNTPYGRDLALVCGPLYTESSGNRPSVGSVRWVERLATQEELVEAEDRAQEEKDAFRICREKIDSRRLEMKLVLVHSMVGESKIWFFYTAESRVDFRELVKDLVGIFKTRIQMHQIGVRDEAQVVGGLGVCGRCYCCHEVSSKLKPVSIKMAKDQNLSLNSMKISGPCGRLLCCLAYEHNFYNEQRRQIPSEGARLTYDDIQWRVIEVNVILGRLKLAGEDGRVLSFPVSAFERSEGRWHLSGAPLETTTVNSGSDSHARR